MALTDKQFEALKAQLQKKKETLGESEYDTFLTRAAGQVGETQPTNDDGFIKDIGQGAAKSAGDLALGIGTIGRKAQGLLSKGVEKVTGIKDFGMGKPGVFDTGSEQNIKAKEVLTRNSTAEKVGGFVGDVASFAIPGTAVTKATKGVNFLARAASLGAADAVTTIAKSGEIDKDAVDAAIIGAAFPVVGKAAGAAKSALIPSGKDAGGRVINSLIKPLLKDFSYGKNPGQAVAEAGITASSLDELAGKIKVVRQQTGEEISQRVAASKATFDASDALNSIDEAIATAQKAPKTNKEIIRRLQDVKDDVFSIGDDGLPQRKLKDLTAPELWELNKEIGDLARWTGNATDDEIINKAIKNSYSTTRSKLEAGVPGLSDVSEKYANLKSAETATEYRDKIAARQGLSSLTSKTTGIGAGLITAAATGGITTPLLVGATVAGLSEAAGSPAFKTKLAAWLASTPKTELKKAFEEAPWLRSSLQSILFDVDETE